MNLDQVYLNWLFGLFGTAIGAIISVIWSSLKDLQKAEKEILARINEIEVLVAGDYVKRVDQDRFAEAILRKLDRIEEKLDMKADK